MYLGPGLALNNVPIWDGTKWVPGDLSAQGVNNTMQGLLGRRVWFSIESIGSTSNILPTGTGWTTPSTVGGVTVDWTTPYRSIDQAVGITAGAANSGTGWRHGSGAGFALTTAAAWAGGWYFIARLGIRTAVATTRSFVGLFNSAGAFPAAADPSAQVNIIGFMNDSGEANWNFKSNDNAGTATGDAFGASFPAQTTNTDFYEFVMSAASGQTGSVQYRAQNIITGAVTSGQLVSNLPVANTFLLPYINVNNGATASLTSMGLNTFYLERYI